MRHVVVVRALVGIASLSVLGAHAVEAQQARPGPGIARVRPFARPDSAAASPDQSPRRATPPRVVIDTGLTILPAPAAAPAPPRPRRFAGSARQLPPTAAVILPPTSGSPRPDSAVRSALMAAAEIPPPLTRPAPPPRSMRVEERALQSVVTMSQEEPAGATGRCKDGTFLTGAVTEERCADKGGLAVRLPERGSAPPRPQPTP